MDKISVQNGAIKLQKLSTESRSRRIWFQVNQRLPKMILLKVSKSWKQFWKLSILPKNEQKTGKNYSNTSQDNFFSCSVRFLEKLKIPFFWDLLTFSDCKLLEADPARPRWNPILKNLVQRISKIVTRKEDVFVFANVFKTL